MNHKNEPSPPTPVTTLMKVATRSVRAMRSLRSRIASRTACSSRWGWSSCPCPCPWPPPWCPPPRKEQEPNAGSCSTLDGFKTQFESPMFGTLWRFLWLSKPVIITQASIQWGNMMSVVYLSFWQVRISIIKHFENINWFPTCGLNLCESCCVKNQNNDKSEVFQHRPLDTMLRTKGVKNFLRKKTAALGPPDRTNNYPTYFGQNVPGMLKLCNVVFGCWLVSCRIFAIWCNSRWPCLVVAARARDRPSSNAFLLELWVTPRCEME